ncbi:CSK1 [Candida pseudojiufengensis]|uniref:CSK1 n=1 Tax=Candida pseudojiufengensis TaxID=497109 RepID=UPI00222462B9|nr:CSK1 [Candida pseudojiufengensis]KAI5960560.1 CSK1 [Candida pseudojiufengensis]
MVSKLKELYTDNQLIHNSPISDIYKVKPIKESSNLTELEKKQDFLILKIVDLDFKIPPHSIKREIETIKVLQEKKKEQSNEGYIGIIEMFNNFQIVDDMILSLKYYPFTLNQLVLNSKYSRKKIKFNSIGDMSGNSNGEYELKNKIKVSELREFIIKMVSSLNFIHQNQIIHRDLKMSNIFFEANDLTKPIIGDFSCCYNLNQPPEDEPLDFKYLDISSGIYKPPELLLGITNYNFEIDYWSFGIILTILFSLNFKSILIKDDLDLNNDSNIHDLHLLSCIFKTFGTPIIEKSINNNESAGREEESQKEDSKEGNNKEEASKEDANKDDANKEEEEDYLYWPELNNNDLHFKKFNLKIQKPLSIENILPKLIIDDSLDFNNDINDPNDINKIKIFFKNLMRYDRNKRKMFID